MIESLFILVLFSESSLFKFTSFFLNCGICNILYYLERKILLNTLWESFTGLVLSLFLCTSGDFFFLYYCIFVLIVAVLTHIYYFLCSFGVYLTSFKNRNQTKNYFLVSPHTKGSQGLFCLMHIGVSATMPFIYTGPLVSTESASEESANCGLK